MPNVQEIPRLRLNDGVHIPQLGFGVFQVAPDDTERAVTEALEAGYRHIDTAAAYRNEKGVGRAIAASGLARDEVFVTTKLWNGDHGHETALRAFDQSLGRLGLDHVDLYLVHWPLPSRDRYVETWKAFEAIKADGRARSIGVSNFQPDHLERLAAETATTPSLNQVELHPRLQQAELRAYHREHGIATEAWSPLAQGGDLLEDPVITEIAEQRDKTPAQVVLRWHVQIGNVVIPKSVTPERIRANLDVFDFELSEDDLSRIEGLDRGERIGPDPDAFDVQ
ncbi:MAG TPA: aldo/keto reductase [Solirubrobacteraceae bacterium]|nr:aldo/keto reductase [Solirubrobacteraceae bacterium]